MCYTANRSNKAVSLVKKWWEIYRVYLVPLISPFKVNTGANFDITFSLRKRETIILRYYRDENHFERKKLKPLSPPFKNTRSEQIILNLHCFGNLKI